MKKKPKLRGVSHEIACYVSALAGVMLVRLAHSADGIIAASVYSTTLVVQYAVSALYHRPMWSPDVRQKLRRLDHAAIYLLIAGSATPMGMVLSPGPRHTLLGIMWGCAAAGVAQTLFWIHRPKALASVIYILMGAVMLPFLPMIHSILGTDPVLLIIAGGVIYSLGGIIYALKKPDPIPDVFGYHEIFHLMVVIASVCHYIAMVEIVEQIGSLAS